MIAELRELGHREACPAHAQLRDDRALLRRLRHTWLGEREPAPAELVQLARLVERVSASEGVGEGELLVRGAELWCLDARAGQVAARSALQSLAPLVAAFLPRDSARERVLSCIVDALPAEDLRELTFCPWGSRQLRSCPCPGECAARQWAEVLAQPRVMSA